MSEWISVKSGFPEVGKLVLCCGAKGGMFLGCFPHAGHSFCLVPNSRNGRCATHWMPLPEPPKD
jgi:hypothetical protein